MDPFRGITVQIIVNGQSLPFYDDPDDVQDASHTRQKYIEAVTGCTFQVKLILKRGFKLYKLRSDDAVRVGIDIGQKRRWKNETSRSQIEQSWAHGRPAEFNFTGGCQLCKESGQWSWSSFTFADLESSKGKSFQTL